MFQISFNFSDLDFETFTFDWNSTYLFENTQTETFDEQPLRKATYVIATVGVVLTGLVTILLIKILVSFPQRRGLPCMWLLFGLSLSHLLLLIHKQLEKHIQDWTESNDSYTLCAILSNIQTSLDCVSIFNSTLLSYFVFIWVYIPKASIGRRVIMFWATAEVISWLLGFGIDYGVATPFVSSIETHFFNEKSKYYCVVDIPEGVMIGLSCTTFLLPYILATVPAFAALVRPCLTKPRIKMASIELTSSPIECQSNPEYFRGDKVESADGIELKQKQHDNENTRSALPWVIFNVINIFLGFVCRLLLRLQYHEFFIDTYWHAFKKGIMIYDLSMLLYYIYLCCMPLVCLILAELRCGTFEKCKSSKFVK